MTETQKKSENTMTETQKNNGGPRLKSKNRLRMHATKVTQTKASFVDACDKSASNHGEFCGCAPPPARSLTTPCALTNHQVRSLCAHCALTNHQTRSLRAHCALTVRSLRAH